MILTGVVLISPFCQKLLYSKFFFFNFASEKFFTLIKIFCFHCFRHGKEQATFKSVIRFVYNFRNVLSHIIHEPCFFLERPFIQQFRRLSQLLKGFGYLKMRNYLQRIISLHLFISEFNIIFLKLHFQIDYNTIFELINYVKVAKIKKQLLQNSANQVFQIFMTDKIVGIYIKQKSIDCNCKRELALYYHNQSEYQQSIIHMNKVEKTKSQQKWTCQACSYENIGLLPYCEICETKCPNKRLLRHLEQDQSQQSNVQDEEDQQKNAEQQNQQSIIQEKSEKKAEQSGKKPSGLVCPSCTYINTKLIQQCEMCQQPLTHQSKKKDTKITCVNCGIKNQTSRTRCVSCRKNIHKKTYGKRSYNRVSKMQKNCKFCRRFIYGVESLQQHQKLCQIIKTGQVKDESLLSYPDQCPFCYNSTKEEGFKVHQEKCEEKKKFYTTNKSFDRMTDLQKSTIIYMHKKCEILHHASRKILLSKVQKLGFTQKDLDNLHHYIMHYAPIIIHVHVNRHMQFFVKDTHYRSQFETSQSSGSLSRTSRISWEDRMFDQRHHNAKDSQRVKYGTINFTNDPKGVRACQSYGQSYFLLKQHVRDRCTFTDMDSSGSTATIGTFRFCFHVLSKLSDVQLKAAIEGSKANEVDSQGVIGTYKQIQIHGPVQFTKDIQRLYINKSQTSVPSPSIFGGGMFGAPSIPINDLGQSPLQMSKKFCSKNGIDYELFEYKQNKQNRALSIFGGLYGSPALLAPPSSSIFSSAPSGSLFGSVPSYIPKKKYQYGEDYI